jgi:ribulose-5-phosphate 4-epimerase/fuculose-1-phosphate aldolase
MDISPPARPVPGADEAIPLTDIATAVAARGLVSAFGHVSRRTSPNTYDITILGDLATLKPGDQVSVDLRHPHLPQGAPGEAWLHSEIYRSRADVGGIVRAQPESTFAAAALTDMLRPVHGQAAWLGGPVPVFPVPRLIRSRELGAAAATALGTVHALLLRANGAVTVGPDARTAATRMWLLATACDVWLRAQAGGEPQYLSEEDIAAWDAVSAPLLARLWETMRRER